MSVRHVDPSVPRSAAYDAYARLAATPVGLTLSRLVAWRIDPYLMRWSGGRIGTGVGIPTLLLQTRGARTGRLRSNGVIYFHDGDRVTVAASLAGAPTHPAWLHNLRADPQVHLNGEPHRAEIVPEADRERVWALADRVFPPFAMYRDQAGAAGRTIELVQFEPR